MKHTIKLLVIVAFAVPAMFFLAPSASLQTKPAVETAGQKFKSIKVLNEMPADQMGKVMNMMSASLGVECKFCHASNDADYEKEGFEHKDEILAKYATALGKAEIKSRKITAQRLEPDGKTTEPEEILQSGQKMQVKTTYGNYVVTEKYDGKTVSKTGNDQPIELKADEAEQIKREAQIFANSDLKAIYAKLDFRFVDRVDGRDAYRITATNADNTRESLLFDVQTGLLVRRIASAPTVLGFFQYQVDYLDYKDFGGVKLPTTIKFAVPNIRWTRKLIDVKINDPAVSAGF